jgi:hypothetical protein
MTREEIKKVLPVIQAFTEGKVIQTKNGDETWITIGKETDLNIESLAEYPDCFRVKPEPKYRPFKDADECWQEMLKHQPFGWLREKKRNVYTQIGFMHTEGIQGTSGGSSNYKAFFDCFSFADGAPFGILEEE